MLAQLRNFAAIRTSPDEAMQGFVEQREVKRVGCPANRRGEVSLSLTRHQIGRLTHTYGRRPLVAYTPEFEWALHHDFSGLSEMLSPSVSAQCSGSSLAGMKLTADGSNRRCACG